MDFENNDMEELNEELDNVIVLNDEDGNEVQFEFLVILKVEDTESENEESYVSVDDEETLNKVFEMFKEKFKDEFNFIEED